MVDSTTGTNPTNNSIIARNYFTGGASVSDTATYNLNGGSASNVYQQTLNSANSTLILATTDAVAPYTTSASLTSVKNSEVACQMTTTDTALAPTLLAIRHAKFSFSIITNNFAYKFFNSTNF